MLQHLLSICTLGEAMGPAEASCALMYSMVACIVRNRCFASVGQVPIKAKLPAVRGVGLVSDKCTRHLHEEFLLSALPLCFSLSLALAFNFTFALLTAALVKVGIRRRTVGLGRAGNILPASQRQRKEKACHQRMGTSKSKRSFNGERSIWPNRDSVDGVLAHACPQGPVST